MKTISLGMAAAFASIILAAPTGFAQAQYPDHAYSGRGPVDEAYEAKQKQASQAAEKGRDLLKKGDVDAAIESFNKAVTLSPSEAEAYIGLAEAYTAKGQYANALKAYRTLIYPASEKNWVSNLANDTATLMKFAILLSRTGQRAEAIQAYAKGLENLSRNSDPPLSVSFTTPNYNPAQFEAAARTAIGIKEYRAGRNDSAITELQQAVRSQPRFALAYFYLGRALSDKGQRAEARAAFEKAAAFGRGEVKTPAQKALKR